jgi:hypothetical protein
MTPVVYVCAVIAFAVVAVILAVFFCILLLLIVVSWAYKLVHSITIRANKEDKWNIIGK